MQPILDQNGHYPLIVDESAFNPLIAFAKKQDTQPYKIIVNWLNFSAKQIAQFNSLFEHQLHNHSLNQPTIYSLSTRGHYRGVDFYSRHDSRTSYPLIADDLTSSVTLSSEEPWVIELFNSSDWDSLLLGQILLTDAGMRFAPGPLLQAWEMGKRHIVLKNPPLHLDDFRLFWQTVQRTGQVELYQQVFSMPEGGSLQHAVGYENIPQQFQQCTWLSGIPALSSGSLNPTTLAHCYQT